MGRHKSTLALMDLIKRAIDIYSPRTVRGVFYDLVRQNVIPNTINAYRRVQYATQAAREDKVIGWLDIIDPGRDPLELTTWRALDDFKLDVPDMLTIDPWPDERPVVWVEKAAQIDPLWRICREYRLPLYFGRGYDSWTSLYLLANECRQRTVPVVWIFGDHDPSGLDIPRALKAFLNRWEIEMPEMKRLALNRDQIHERKLPPQKVKDDEWQKSQGKGKKKGDPRAEAYKIQYGKECWELDALGPTEIQSLLRGAIAMQLDLDHLKSVLAQEKADREDLRELLA